MKKITLLCIAVLMTVFTAIGQTIVLNEDFESAPYELSSSGTVSWGINSRLHASGSFSDSCTVGLSSTSYLTTNSFSTVGNTSVLLEFKHICKIESGDAGQVEYSIDGGTTWTLITNAYYLGTGSFTTNKFNEGSYVADWQFGVGTAVPQNSWWKTEQFDLGTLIGNQANVMIRFKLNDANNNGANQRTGWYLDDVKVTVAPSELVPPTITLVPVIYQDTVYTTGPFEIKAAISDASGIDTATLTYSINGGPNIVIPMTVLLADTFHATIPAQGYNTRIDYSISATDAALAANVATNTGNWFFIKKPAPVAIIGTGTTTTYYLPVYGLYDYSWSDLIYTADEIGMSGFIDSIFFNVATLSSAYTYNNQSIFIESTPQNSFAAAAYPVTTSMTQIYSGNYSFTGTGWAKITLSTPFYYNGSDNLRIVWLNNDGIWTSGYPSFYYTSTSPDYRVQYNSDDDAMPTIGNLTYNRPNLKIAFQSNNNVNDAMVMQITEPLSTPIPITGTPYPVKTIIRNIGSDTLTSLTIDWSVDGVLQTTYPWTGSLLQDQNTAELTLGNATFTVLGNHQIKVWTSLPNGVADEGTLNDTLVKNYFACDNILAGDYTINPVTPTGGTNFQYFADVLNALENCGISDTTVFNIAAGTYDTTLTFNGAIPGAGPDACVIFQSASGVNTDVVLRNNATTAAANNIVKLSGTSHVQFKNMSFLTQDTLYGTAIRIEGGSHYNLFEGNIIAGQTTTLTSTDMALIYNSSTVNDTNNIIRNNVLNNGSYGIYWYGVSTTDLEKNNVIEGNTLNNFYYYGIYSYYQKGIVIRGNNLSTNSAYSYVAGMYLNYNDYSIIEKNKVFVPAYYGIYFYYSDGDATTHSRIVNNMIQVGGTSTSYGLYTYYSNYVDVFHNTINSNSSSGRSMYIYYGGNLNIQNNFITNIGGGFAIYKSSSSTVFESDYNNLYTTGAVLGYNGTNTADLAAWKTSTGKDSHSVSVAPIYYGPSDLHTMAFTIDGLATPLGITEDIDGEPRNMTTPDMGADEFTPLMQEAGLISISLPTDGCDLALGNIGIQIVCHGLNAINGNLNAFYSIDGGAPVSQAVTTQILPGDTLDFTFSTPADFSVGATDHIFQVESWIALVGDPLPLNDTLEATVLSLHNPAPAVFSNATIPYGTSATLSATSVDSIMWFADPTMATFLGTGSSFTTPVLYDTTIYYVASTSGIYYNYTFDTDLQGWTALTPCPSYTSYNWAWNSDGGTGTAWMVNPSNYSSAVLKSPSVQVYGDSIGYSFRHRFNTESCCDRGYIAYRIDGGTWTHLTPTTGLYTANDNLYYDPLLAACVSGPTVGTFGGASASYFVSSGKIPLNGGTNLELAFAFSSDGSLSYDGWFIDEVTIGKPSCTAQVSPDTVFVTGAPATDVGVIAIDAPNDGVELSNSETVTVRVKNYGTAAASNIPVNFKVDGGAAVTETLAGPVNPGDTASFTFSVGADLSAVGTYEIAAYTTLSGDLITVNDTAKKQVICSPIIYCTSGATSTGDEDILNVTIGSLNNTSPSPHTMMYTDYTSIPPAYLSHGQTYQMSVTETDDAGTYYSGYIEAYIDFNHDGIYQEPEEVVLGGAYTSANQTNTITGNVTIPLTAYTGTTGMRVICWEGSSTTATTVVPCGTYGYGETEDYLVTLAPQIPNDAGVISIDSPGFIQSEDSQVPVVVTVRNYGTNTLTSIPVEYVVNGGTPVAYTWTGSLAPNTTTQITLPDITILPDSNEICAYTIVVDDTNTFNDDECAWFYGLPPAIIFEDDMENGTQLYTDAPTLWEHGVPTADVINIAHSPDNVWTTNLDGDYPNSASGFVYTPNMNFFGVNGAYLTFYYWIDAEENNDGGYIQYTTNNGATWSSLGSINDPAGFNWFESYASGTPAWSKATNGWKPAFIKLNAVSGYSIVKFRFGFKSNTTTTNNGFAIDDIKILGPAVAIDGGVIEVVDPAAASTPGTATTVTVKIKNFGTDTLTSIPLSYKLDTGFPPQNGTWTGTLLPDSTVDYTFTTTFPGPSVGYELCAYTKITGDPYKGNDTTCVLIGEVGFEEETFNGVVLLQNIPNPASAQTEISFNLPAPGKCVLTLRNTLGELIQTTTIDGQSGKNSVNVDLSNLGQGIYVYTLEYKDVMLTRRLSVMR